MREVEQTVKHEVRIEPTLRTYFDSALARICPSMELVMVEHGLVSLVVDTGTVEDDHNRDHARQYSEQLGLRCHREDIARSTCAHCKGRDRELDRLPLFRIDAHERRHMSRGTLLHALLVGAFRGVLVCS